MGRIKNRLWVRKDNPLILTGKEEKSYTIHTDERIEISLTSMEYKGTGHLYKKFINKEVKGGKNRDLFSPNRKDPKMYTGDILMEE